MCVARWHRSQTYLLVVAVLPITNALQHDLPHFLGRLRGHHVLQQLVLRQLLPAHAANVEHHTLNLHRVLPHVIEVLHRHGELVDFLSPVEQRGVVQKPLGGHDALG